MSQPQELTSEEKVRVIELLEDQASYYDKKAEEFKADEKIYRYLAEQARQLAEKNKGELPAGE